MFYNCGSLLRLPDISRWNVRNVHDIKNIFSGCSSLIQLPNISNWKLGYLYELHDFGEYPNSLYEMSSMFENCVNSDISFNSLTTFEQHKLLIKINYY